MPVEFKGRRQCLQGSQLDDGGPSGVAVSVEAPSFGGGTGRAAEAAGIRGRSPTLMARASVLAWPCNAADAARRRLEGGREGRPGAPRRPRPRQQSSPPAGDRNATREELTHFLAVTERTSRPRPGPRATAPAEAPRTSGGGLPGARMRRHQGERVPVGQPSRAVAAGSTVVRPGPGVVSGQAGVARRGRTGTHRADSAGSIVCSHSATSSSTSSRQREPRRRPRG
jgi:hypothetical protein